MVGLIPFSSFFFLMEGLVSIGEHIKIKTKVKKIIILLNLLLCSKARHTVNYYNALMILPSIIARETLSFSGKIVFPWGLNGITNCLG